MSLTRRRFLAAGVSLAGGGIGGQSPPLPDRISSSGGLLETALEARRDLAELLPGLRRGNVYSFSGRVPGPILEARPGDTLRIRFTNSLPEPTNVHWHGLHVSPDNFADNVFLEIEPGETLTYEFRIPVGHPAGAFWYHPHLHGRTARQLGGGMAGRIIVRGDLDEIPEIADAVEHYLVLKDFGIYPDATVSAGPTLTCNGAVNPRLALPQGGLLRLRLLNASIDLYFRLRLENHPWYLMATDGGGIPEPIELTELLISPGERAEVLIRGERPPAAYRLLNFAWEGQGMAGMPGMTSGDPGSPVCNIAYEGRADREIPLPARLIDVIPLPPPTLPLRALEFRSSDLSFLINGRPFDHERIDTRVKLNTTEDWEIINADQMDHPVHLHTNFFQILDPGGEPRRAWSDIMNVRGGTRRRFRVRFTDYPGRTVYHCHRVAHGDLGIMGVIEMEPNRPPPARRRQQVKAP